MPLEILNIEDISAHIPIAYSEGGVKAGFPSPAQDYMDKTIDFNRELITHKATTFCTRVSGDSMIDAYIHDGDYLIVDRSLCITHDVAGFNQNSDPEFRVHHKYDIIDAKEKYMNEGWNDKASLPAEWQRALKWSGVNDW